jgi:hypothetical protein
MKLLFMQFSPTSRHFIPFWSKYSPQHTPIHWREYAAHLRNTPIRYGDSFICTAIPLKVAFLELWRQDHCGSERTLSGGRGWKPSFSATPIRSTKTNTVLRVWPSFFLWEVMFPTISWGQTFI